MFNPETFALENVNMYAFKENLISAFESKRTKRKLDKQIAKEKSPAFRTWNCGKRSNALAAVGTWWASNTIFIR